MIANSILKLKENGLITSPEEDPHIVEQLGEAGRTLRESEGEGGGGGGGGGGEREREVGRTLRESEGEGRREHLGRERERGGENTEGERG